jgi:hypothetical protein
VSILSATSIYASRTSILKDLIRDLVLPPYASSATLDPCYCDINYLGIAVMILLRARDVSELVFYSLCLEVNRDLLISLDGV